MREKESEAKGREGKGQKYTYARGRNLRDSERAKSSRRGCYVEYS